jgi:hypothetical protein
MLHYQNPCALRRKLNLNVFLRALSISYRAAVYAASNCARSESRRGGERVNMRAQAAIIIPQQPHAAAHSVSAPRQLFELFLCLPFCALFSRECGSWVRRGVFAVGEIKADKLLCESKSLRIISSLISRDRERAARRVLILIRMRERP